MEPIKIDDLSFRHEKSTKRLFHGISMKLYPGKVYLLKGGNGKGKSTLLKMLNREDLPKGESFGTISIQHKKEVALVDQNYDQLIVDSFTFKENLTFAKYGRFPSLFRFGKGKKESPIWMERLGINPCILAGQLSGGQRQILAILMILAKKPRLLLLDEITSALDASNSQIVLESIKEFAVELSVAVVMVSHDPYIERNHQLEVCCEL